jgi:hypothetical protein
MGYFRMVIWGLGTSVAMGAGGTALAVGAILVVGVAAGYAVAKATIE